MDKALIVIDYTNDFVAEGGALTCGKPAQDLDERIAGLVRHFHAPGHYIVVANDTHIENDEFHPETKLFPPHNILATDGAYNYGRTSDAIWSCFNSRPEEEALKHFHFIEKTRYSAFAGTDLYLRLRERGINEIHLVGVCTDICILHTAIDAYNLGFKTVIHKDGVASFSPIGHDWALGHFTSVLGAEVVENYKL